MAIREGHDSSSTPLAETTVTARVTFDDGQPAAGSMVAASPVERRGGVISVGNTDAAGSFQLKLLAGLSYVMRAWITKPDRQTETVIFVDKQTEAVQLTIRR